MNDRSRSPFWTANPLTWSAGGGSNRADVDTSAGAAGAGSILLSPFEAPQPQPLLFTSPPQLEQPQSFFSQPQLLASQPQLLVSQPQLEQPQL